ncbi:TrbG/VirB9 family P-type conjugative transfer protein [Pusillimonas sp. T7-7]|uniref:TrbG/VirB9 family P-type conjugative transfer protein n=1 Tax=Pusillimonas sp. (strain T7-7) TaxID=1007105 RepID=UPI00130539AC|nr:TrbG/VirB9 family P-type conjugative transfer protein [Pusillimonas sp. T7-7]
MAWTKLLLAGLLASTAVHSWALDIPKASPKDKRIRITQYDRNDVIKISTMTGVATHIELSDDETFITHAFGDKEAYDFNQFEKHLLLKPTAPQANTNLIVITNKRRYAFLLEHVAEGSGKEVHSLTLDYPELEQLRLSAQKRFEDIDQALANTGLAVNWTGYTMSGDETLAPVSAWDDGAQTWLRFAPGQDLPAVYFVDADGQEVIANRHMYDAHTIVMHRVAAKWHLRLGDQVLAIYNEHSNQTRSLPTRTISPEIERVLRKEPDQ